MGDALPVVKLGTGRSARAIATKNQHTCALLDNDQIKCWGWNSYGQLGVGDTNARGDGPGEVGDALPIVNLGTGRSARAVATGFEHTCALLDNGQIKCWGHNDVGQLGLGVAGDRGDNPGEMGDALPSVDLGTGRSARAIAAGKSHTCAILDNDQVKCWGRNDVGQLGLGDTQYRGAQGGMGDALPSVDLGTGRSARAIAEGESHTCVLLDNDQVKCWGDNSWGQLGLGDTNNRGDQPGEMGDVLPAIDLAP
jgi:alpha-tubulin suppressor-like RCC1 family protein